MDFLQPHSLNEALALKAERPEAVPLAGGTDIMVDLNFDRARPPALLDVTSVSELRSSQEMDGVVHLGAGVTYTDLIEEWSIHLPGLALAARTVGSPQIRNRATLAGNLGTASPAGDALPPLVATGANVTVASTRGDRTLPVTAFVTGPKQNTLAPDELITSVAVPRASGPQQFSKIGTRNAMVIAVTSFAIALNVAERTVRACIGSAGPRPIVPQEAEDFATGALEEAGVWDTGAPPPEDALGRFGELVAAAARPIDDVRGTARYRRHALSVMARRTLGWACSELGPA
ncbi:FAD binding domain-containing protein [soil metagenome]